MHQVASNFVYLDTSYENYKCAHLVTFDWHSRPHVGQNMKLNGLDISKITGLMKMKLCMDTVYSKSNSLIFILLCYF